MRAIVADEDARRDRSRAAALVASVLLATTLLLFAVGYQLPVWLGAGPSAEPPGGMMRLAEPRALEDFTLRDQHGEMFDRARLGGRWTFLIFGYSNCPDVCPMTLEVLAEVLERLSSAPPAYAPPGVVLVSVDPARDDADALARYLARFDERFVGLSGDPSQLERLARSLSVRFASGPARTRGPALIEHTALIALIDPEARLTAGFVLPYDAGAIADGFRDIAAWPARTSPAMRD